MLSIKKEIRASLQRGKELDFCRLLAMHCHTAATRGLALAILEKTMEQDALEAPVFVEPFVEEEGKCCCHRPNVR